MHTYTHIHTQTSSLASYILSFLYFTSSKSTEDSVATLYSQQFTIKLFPFYSSQDFMKSSRRSV